MRWTWITWVIGVACMLYPAILYSALRFGFFAVSAADLRPSGFAILLAAGGALAALIALVNAKRSNEVAHAVAGLITNAMAIAGGLFVAAIVLLVPIARQHAEDERKAQTNKRWIEPTQEAAIQNVMIKPEAVNAPPTAKEESASSGLSIASFTLANSACDFRAWSADGTRFYGLPGDPDGNRTLCEVTVPDFTIRRQLAVNKEYCRVTVAGDKVVLYKNWLRRLLVVDAGSLEARKTVEWQEVGPEVVGLPQSPAILMPRMSMAEGGLLNAGLWLSLFDLDSQKILRQRAVFTEDGINVGAEVSVAPDGKALAVICRSQFAWYAVHGDSIQLQGTVPIPEEGRNEHHVAVDSQYAAAFWNRKRFDVYGNDDPSKPRYTIQSESGVRDIAFDPATKQLYLLDYDGRFHVFSTKGELRKKVTLNAGRDVRGWSDCSALHVNPRGRHVLVESSKKMFWIDIPDSSPDAEKR
jgi:hypothetical protein